MTRLNVILKDMIAELDNKRKQNQPEINQVPPTPLEILLSKIPNYAG